jgi:hypothetical protein
MATTPNGATPSPAYKRVESPRESLDSVACVSMITGKPLADILKVAIETFKLRPTNGPYYLSDEHRLQILFVKYGFVAKNYKEMTTINELPDLCLVWQDTDPDMEQGRVLLFHRTKDFSDPKKNYAYVIDPQPQADPSLGTRTDIAALGLTWFMPVSPMGKAPGK